jgi:hypothetical protein
MVYKLKSCFACSKTSGNFPLKKITSWNSINKQRIIYIVTKTCAVKILNKLIAFAILFMMFELCLYECQTLSSNSEHDD